MISKTLLLLSIASASTLASTFTKIEFVDLTRISIPLAEQTLGFDTSSDVSNSDIENAIKTFKRTGYFKDVIAIRNEDVLKIVFTEIPLISSLEIKGYKNSLNPQELREYTGIKIGSMLSDEAIATAKKNITKSLNDDGRVDFKISINTVDYANGTIGVSIDVDEGKVIIIEKISLKGAKNLTYADFKAEIANREHQFMGWFWGRDDGKLNLAEIELDNLRMRDIYFKSGYLDASVPKALVDVNFQKYEASVNYDITEGEQYNVSEISVIYAGKDFTNEELVSSLLLKKDNVLKIDSFRTDTDSLQRKIADLGFAYCEVKPTIIKQPETHTAKVSFEIIPGEKVVISNVLIDGNNRTTDSVIRRQLFLASGDTYSKSDIEDSANALRRSGYFETVTIEEKRISPTKMELIVIVKETMTGSFQVGGGYGSFAGLTATVSVQESNIFGTGINIGAKVEISQRQKNYAFNISNPQLNDSDYSGNFSIYSNTDKLPDFSIISNGGTVGTGHRFSRYWSGYLGYTYTGTSYDNLPDLAIDPLASQYYQSFTKSSVSASASFNNTNDFFFPTTGTMFNFSLENAGQLGGDADFVKTRAKYNQYFDLSPITGKDLSIRLKTTHRQLFDTGFVPLSERLYLGGIGSVRGYENFSISPRTHSNGSFYLFGGEQSISTSAELSFPLIPQARMKGVLFTDWGMIGNSHLDDIIRGSYGVGIEWVSPMGPLQLMLANPIGAEKHDRTSVFEFSIGQSF